MPIFFKDIIVDNIFSSFVFLWEFCNMVLTENNSHGCH